MQANDAFRDQVLVGFHFADHGTAVARLRECLVFGSGSTVFEAEQRFTGFDHVALAAEQFLDPAGARRRHVDDCLGGFHRDQGLAGFDLVAGSNVPFDDFGVRQPLAEIGKFEDVHRYSMVSWTASRMRFTPGMYWSSWRYSGMTIS